MTYVEVHKHVSRYYKVNISFNATYDQIQEIDDKIFELENEYDVEIDFFNGNGACFPYIICEGENKDDCINFIISMNEFLKGLGIKVSL